MSNDKQVNDSRITILAIVIFILAVFLILCLFRIQVLKGESYTVAASKQHKIYQNLSPIRGEVFVERKDYKSNNGLYPIIVNEEVYEVYANPTIIKEPRNLSQEIAKILELDEEKLYEKFQKENDTDELVMRSVSEEKVAQLQKIKYEGLGFRPEQNRFYPEANIYSHITGFLGYDEDKRVGQYGIEGGRENILAGESGQVAMEKDISGNWIPTSQKLLTEVVDGSDLVLTIDNSIQYFVCDALKKGIEKYGAPSGSITIMNPKTGAILAMCGYPDFDPNNYSKVDNINVYKNQTITESYEPGSIFKPITMAAAIDLRAVTPETTYEDTGEVKIDIYTLKNSDKKAHGQPNMIRVLDESLNTGAIFAMRQIGPNKFKDYVKKFGFGESTGIELGPEAIGNISSLEKSGEIYAATASYGQGITVTPIQMLAAFSAIANKGMLIKPYIIAKIINPNGEVTETKPQQVRQVISAETATTIRAMLVSVVKSGHANKAGVPGYYVAGKTGTAQVAKKGGYSENLYIHSFVGFAPVDDPVFLALVKLDYPTAVNYAADSAAPIFGQIAKFILNYYQVPPDEDF